MKLHYYLSAVIAVMMLPVTHLGFPALAEAQTAVDVKNEGRDITITVPIDAAWADKDTAKLWKKSAENYWNDAFKELNPYKGCLNLHLKLDIEPVGDYREDRPVGPPPKERPGRHMVFAIGQVSEDTPHGGIVHTDPYKEATNGVFDPMFNDPTKKNAVAHEIGHLLGLPDEYTEVSKHPRKTKPLPGRENTLMADGGRIDNVLIKALVSRIRKVTDKVRDCPQEVTLNLKWKDMEKIPYPNNERATYYNVRFKLTIVDSSEEIATWTEWIRVPGGHTHYGAEGWKTIKVRLSDYPTKDELVAHAKRESGLEFTASPSPR